MELVSEAIAFAVKAHDGMRRKKSDAPYILHPMEAAVIVGTMTDDQNLIAAAALHDVVEDANITIDEIEGNSVSVFGSLWSLKPRISELTCRLNQPGVSARRNLWQC